MSFKQILKGMFLINDGSQAPHLTKSEYFSQHPERVAGGVARCECGSTETRQVCAPVNSSPIFHVCSACKKTLFTTNIYGE